MQMEPDVRQNGRICLYDNVRFVLICLVVIGHCAIWHDIFPGLVVFIYSFHMPAFIFLAGVFHKNERIVPKTVSYICIGFMMKAGYFLGNVLVHEVEPFFVFSEANVPWFMFVLAGYTASSYVLRGIDKRFLLLTAGVFGCFVGYDQTIGAFLALSRGFVFYPFYILGQMCDRERLAAVSRKRALRFTGGAVLTVGGAIACAVLTDRSLMIPLTGGEPFPAEIFPWGPVWRILQYGVGLLFCFSLLCVVPDRRLPVVTVMGGRTMQVYFWHWPAVRVIAAVTGIGSMLCAAAPGRIVYVLLNIALVFLLSAKPFSFPTDFILYYTGVRRKRPALFPKERTGLP